MAIPQTNYFQNKTWNCTTCRWPKPRRIRRIAGEATQKESTARHDKEDAEDDEEEEEEQEAKAKKKKRLKKSEAKVGIIQAEQTPMGSCLSFLFGRKKQNKRQFYVAGSQAKNKTKQQQR